jgi:hypothetical protein
MVDDSYLDEKTTRVERRKTTLTVRFPVISWEIVATVVFLPPLGSEARGTAEGVNTTLTRSFRDLFQCSFCKWLFLEVLLKAQRLPEGVLSFIALFGFPVGHS